MQGHHGASRRAWTVCISVKSRCACAFLELSKVPACAAGSSSTIGLVGAGETLVNAPVPTSILGQTMYQSCLGALVQVSRPVLVGYSSSQASADTLGPGVGCLRPAHSWSRCQKVVP